MNDTAIMQKDENCITMDLKKYNWNMTKLQNYNNDSVEITISANSYRAARINKTGIVSITVRSYENN